MPIEPVKPHHTAQILRLRDENGELDEALAPDIDDDQLAAMHRTMLLSRRLDDRMLVLQRQGRIGTFGPARGQEAAQVGCAAAMRRTDWLVPSYRETTFALWRGTPISGLLLYIAGFNEGGAIPQEQNDLPIAIPVGTQMLQAVGIGYALARERADAAVVTCFGDGATSQGDFHEAMNFAAVFGAPVVFFCQNNQYAISVPREKQTRSRTIVQKAMGYGMRGVQVDGNDVLAVHAAAKDALERARRDHEPTLIEAVTYRLGVHTTADDPTKYRDEEEVEAWRAHDPLPRVQELLRERGRLDDDSLEREEAEVAERIEAAWTQAQDEIETLRGRPAHMFEHVFAERPYALERQRRAFLGEEEG
jgi:pyruvate dehydrogenase E1 component alpha subunit